VTDEVYDETDRAEALRLRRLLAEQDARGLQLAAEIESLHAALDGCQQLHGLRAEAERIKQAEIESLQDEIQKLWEDRNRWQLHDIEKQREVGRLRAALEQIEHLLDEEASGMDMPEEIHQAIRDYYAKTPGGGPRIVSFYESDAYNAQEKAWETAHAALAEEVMPIHTDP